MDPEAKPDLTEPSHDQATGSTPTKMPKWRRSLGFSTTAHDIPSPDDSTDDIDEVKSRPEKWSMGVLNDRETEEVPGV